MLDNETNLPSAPLHPEDRKLLEQIDGIACRMESSIVAVWCDGGSNQRILIGTAFFARRNERSFIVTALHNFTNNEGVGLKIEFSGKVWELNEMPPCISKEDDLWLAETNAELQQDLRDVFMATLCNGESRRLAIGTGAVLIGYPGSLNKPGTPFSLLPISTTLETRSLTTPNTLPKPILYQIPDDGFFKSDGSFVMHRPEISGMSGGPTFSWFFFRGVNDAEVRLHYFLQGMIVLWQGRDGYAVATSAERIAVLVSQCMHVRA